MLLCYSYCPEKFAKPLSATEKIEFRRKQRHMSEVRRFDNQRRASAPQIEPYVRPKREMVSGYLHGIGGDYNLMDKRSLCRTVRPVSLEGDDAAVKYIQDCLDEENRAAEAVAEVRANRRHSIMKSFACQAQEMRALYDKTGLPELKASQDMPERLSKIADRQLARRSPPKRRSWTDVHEASELLNRSYVPALNRMRKYFDEEN